MQHNYLTQYKQLLKLKDDSFFIKIEHADAIVANVYKIVRPNQSSLILKICERHNDYTNETYFLNYFAKKIPTPKLIRAIEPSKNLPGAVLLEYLSGDLLSPSLITKELAFELGKTLALIHSNSTDGFGYLNKNLLEDLNKNLNKKINIDIQKNLNLTKHPKTHFNEKFKENIEECKNHLPNKLISQSLNYFLRSSYLLENIDGPCIIHRDFRPGNIIIEDNKLHGIIDWSSARASFAEEDFCSIEHCNWEDFNGHKDIFLQGYSSIRTVPNYKKIMLLLRLNRALATIGFTVKHETWNTTNTKLYQTNRNFLENFKFSNVSL